jgi:hypothetical protein
MHSVGTRTLSGWWLAGGAVFAACAVLAGFAILLGYAHEPGPAGRVPIRCPAPAAPSLDPIRPTLFLFAHPQCPCTRATLSELDRIAAHGAGRLRIRVYFLSEPELGEELLHGHLWSVASGIPGVEVRADDSGAIARSFGVETSGHALLYASDGHLLFEGGITGARGHEGDNAGETSILEAVLGGIPSCRSTPVYGCSLGDGAVDEEKSITP